MEAGSRRGLYPIGVVEQLTGLTARQIRYYEANGLLRPERTPGRQRLYSDQEIERLKEIKALMARGMNLQSVRALLEKRGSLAQAAALRRSAVAAPPRPAGPRLPGQAPLTSIYPVTNRAALEERLDRGREPR